MSGYAAYGRVQNATDDQRSVEYRLLAQVTAALSRAKDAPENAALFFDALQWNKQVWDAFMCDLASGNNQLPKELRAKLIGLALWVARETSAAMSRQGDIDALIAVNRTIMQGLSPMPVAAAAMSMPPAAVSAAL